MLPAVHEVLQRRWCRVPELAVLHVHTVAEEERVAGHVQQVHEAQGDEEANDHCHQHGCNRAVNVVVRGLVSKCARSGQPICKRARGDGDDTRAKDAEHKRGAIQDRHGASQLDNHCDGTPGGVAETIRCYGHVDVGVLVHELDALLATADATQAASEDAVQGMVMHLLVLLLGILYDLLDRLQRCYQQGAEREGPRVAPQAYVEAIPYGAAAHVLRLFVVEFRVVVLSHRVRHGELVDRGREGEQPERHEHVEYDHVVLFPGKVQVARHSIASEVVDLGCGDQTQKPI
mmetsp:Transcript_59269/g.183861  ORF Transcript_59269/g.183861 Transcript_59269/m.183861 type:complete len:289 (+) Transcript_59269:79-945(+)